MENVPFKDVELTISTLGEQYVEKLLTILANSLEISRHLEYYLHWTQHVLTYHGPRIKPQQNMPALISLQKWLTRRHEQLSKICDFNRYTMQYVVRQSALMAKDDKTEAMAYEDEDDYLPERNDQEYESSMNQIKIIV
ncbi:hypothetical protein AMK59_7776, partial [Oryctes borbonicus]